MAAASIASRIFGAIATDLRTQFRCPSKSLTAAVLTKRWSQQSRPIVDRVIQRLDANPDDQILEVGYGRGDGISAAHEVVKQGKGTIFGLEVSAYMDSLANKRFALEIAEEGNIVLDLITHLAHVPYPNDTFNGIFHVDVFYFWQQDDMRRIIDEFMRILKPGGRLICGLENERLKLLEKKGILNAQESDAMRYIENLEPAGFSDVSVTYDEIPESRREAMVITAVKPLASDAYYDPEAKMRSLEIEIKKNLALKSLISSKRAMPADLKERLDELKGI